MGRRAVVLDPMVRPCSVRPGVEVLVKHCFPPAPSVPLIGRVLSLEKP